MTFLVFITFLLAGQMQTEIVAPVGTPQECYTVALFRIKERAAELNLPITDFTPQCKQFTLPK